MRFRNEPKEEDTVTQGAWLSMIRAVMIDNLSQKGGLQLKIR